MRIIEINAASPPSRVLIGKQGENNATQLIFDISAFRACYGDGNAALLHKRKADSAAYPVALERIGDTVVWTITAADTAMDGEGMAEIRWMVGETLAKTVTFRTVVRRALEEGAEPPEPLEGYVNALEVAKSNAIQVAQDIRDAADRGDFDGKPGDPGIEIRPGEVVQLVEGKDLDAAVAELKSLIESGKLKPSDVKSIIADYLEEHPETDPTVPDWAKAETKPIYTAAEVHALPDTTVIPPAYDDGELRRAISEKQDAITDLAEIRSGAIAGATAVQPVSGKGLSTNDYTDTAKAKVDAIPTDPKYTDTVYDDTKLKEEIAKKATNPEKPVVGQWGRVKEIDDDGQPVWETAELPMVDGSKLGVVAVSSTFGTQNNTAGGVSSGVLSLYKATTQNISNRASNYQPIVPNNLDYAVKAAMCDGKGPAWSPEEQTAAQQRIGITHTLTVTANTYDGVVVTGQTVTVRVGDASGEIYREAEYNGQPVSFSLPSGFAYHVSISNNLEHHFNPTSESGVVKDVDISIILSYSDFSTIKTAADIQGALDSGMDLSELVGEQITCAFDETKTLAWDVVDYDATAGEVTLLTYDCLPNDMVFEPSQALAYFEDGLGAGNYCFTNGGKQYYFTLTKSIPAGGQLRATTTAFTTHESQEATANYEQGTVSETVIEGAASIGTTASGNLNHMDRVLYGSNNFAESGLFAWLNSDAPANTKMPRINKFSRPYPVAQKGFVARLDPSFVGVVADTDWKCMTSSVYEAPAELGGIAPKSSQYSVRAKFALASTREIFGTTNGVGDGTEQFDLYVDSVNADRIKRYNGTAKYWWLRAPYPAYANLVRSVDTSGALYNYFSASNSFGVVPACKIRKSAQSDPLGAASGSENNA